MGKKSTAICDNTDIVEAINIFETNAKDGRKIENERLSVDKEWLKEFFREHRNIRMFKVVKSKPIGGIYIKRGFHFDAFCVKRKDPQYGVYGIYSCALYFVII